MDLQTRDDMWDAILPNSVFFELMVKVVVMLMKNPTVINLYDYHSTRRPQEVKGILISLDDHLESLNDIFWLSPIIRDLSSYDYLSRNPLVIADIDGVETLCLSTRFIGESIYRFEDLAQGSVRKIGSHHVMYASLEEFMERVWIARRFRLTKTIRS